MVPCALLCGAFFVAIETGLGRADFVELGASKVRQGHYMDIVAYLALPSFVWVAEQLARRWRVVAPALVVLLVVAIAANTHALVDGARESTPERALFEDTVLAIPTLALASEVPRTIKPFGGSATPISVGWLLDIAREGRLPRRQHVTPTTRAIAELRLSLVVGRAPESQCHPFAPGVTRRLEKNDALRFRGDGIWALQLGRGQPVAAVFLRAFDKPHEWQIRNIGRPLTLGFQPSQSKFPPPMLCD